MSAFIIHPFIFFLVVFVLRAQKDNADVLHVRELCGNILCVDFVGHFLFYNFYDYHGLEIFVKVKRPA